MSIKKKDVLSLAFSPCPNDTYIFHGLVHGLSACGLSFATPVLADVEELNRQALKGRFDVSKLSFHGFAHVLDEYSLLSAGSALGRGCGPLLVTARPDFNIIPGVKIAIPGEMTTAALLLRLFLEVEAEFKVMRFDRIVDALAAGEVDYGVIIHESRFTYEKMNLFCEQDLGEWWEKKTGLPIPLGCIGARTSLGTARLKEIDGAIRDSLLFARENPRESLAYIRQYAQEMVDDVLKSHIALYVNDFSLELGVEGVAAVEELFALGQSKGIIPAGKSLNYVGRK